MGCLPAEDWEWFAKQREKANYIFVALPVTAKNLLAAPDLAHVTARVFVQWP